MEKKLLQAAGLALVLAMAPGAARSVEVYNNGKDLSVDLGGREQLLGTFQNSTSTDYKPGAGNGNRDHTAIYLFQHESRLDLGANLDGTKFFMEESLGSEAFLNNSNDYSYNLFELNADIPVTDNTSVVAGVFRSPESVRDATWDANMLFTGESQLANLFFNHGSDLGVYAKGQFGSVDALLGVVQGTANLPQRYLPERLDQPVPVIARVGYGNITDAPDRVLQRDFAKIDSLKWRLGAGAYWLADDNAGHGDLMSQMSGQAENTKGPFFQGNMLFSKTYYNPFLAAGAYTETSSLGPVDNQFYQVNVNGMFRLPLGDNALVGGAEWDFEQFIMKGVYSHPVVINGQSYHYGQLTVQGGEAYLGYEAPKWWIATRADVLVPDYLLGVQQGATFNSAFKNNTVWEITFPSLGYKINKYVDLTAELEHNLNGTEAIDTDGVYELKTVPIESTTTLKTQAYQMTGRLQLQVAF